MSVGQWFICIALGSGVLLWRYVLRVLPVERLCPKVTLKEYVYIL